MRIRRKRWKSIPKRILLYGLIFLFVVFSFVPILWLVEGSFKTHSQNIAIPPLWIFPPTLENYETILAVAAPYFFNSAVITLGSTFFSLLLAIPAAYALSRLNLKGKDTIKMTILSIRMGPAFASIVPFYLLMKNFGPFDLLDTHIALILVYTVFNLTFLIWLLEGFINEIPLQLEESAMLDGCSRLGALRHITLPLILPGLVVASTLCFIFSWNEYFFALTLTRESAVTVPVGIATRVSFMNIPWEEMCAYSTLAILPTLIVAILFRKYLVRGLTFGAIKG
jgi:ABC-type glycerol-3-phosphate transport system permease component